MASGCSASAGPDSVPSASGQPDEPFEVSTVELPYRTCGKPQKIGRTIYATVSRGVDQGDSLISYDLDTGSIVTLVEAPDLIGWFVVNDDWLAWSEDMELFAMPVQGGERQLVSNSRDLYAPDIDGDLLAWDDLSEERTHRIVVKDLRSGETTELAELQLADLYNNFPTWAGGRLVWTDVIDGDGRYFVYDRHTGVTVEYTLADEEFKYPGYAELSGDRIYSLNFDRVDEWDWTIQQLGYYSEKDERFVPVVDDDFLVGSFRVSDEYVAVIDSEHALAFQRTDAEPGADEWIRPVKGPVDFIEASLDGTFIATRDSSNDGKCTLLVLEPGE